MSQRPSDPRIALPPVTHRNWERVDAVDGILPVAGRRAIVVNERGSQHDYRVWGEVRSSAGTRVVDVVTEEAWWRHRNLAMRAETIRWPAAAVWVEV